MSISYHDALVAAAAAALVLAMAVAHALIVPSDSAPQPTLSSLRRADVEDSYPLDCWPNSRSFNATDGATHCYLLGPDTTTATRRIILVHGLTLVWPGMKIFVEGLRDAGFQVCVYDLYGRGYSAAPGIRYDEALYVRQLEDVVEHLGWSAFHLLGYSLGGAIATCYAARHPQRVQRLVLLAPAGLKRTLGGLAAFLSVPVLGPLLGYAVGRSMMIKMGNQDENDDPAIRESPENAHRKRVSELHVLRHPGFLRAVFSTVKHGPLFKLDDRFAAISESLGDRIICIWGDKDKVVDYESESVRFRELVPNAKFVTITGEKHGIVPERPYECLKHILSFLVSDAKTH